MDSIEHDQDAQARRTRGATMERMGLCVSDATDIMRKAGAEIDRLRAENERLRSALADFFGPNAMVSEDGIRRMIDHEVGVESYEDKRGREMALRVAVRRARAALK